MKAWRLLQFIACLVLCYAVAVFGSLFSSQASGDWYAALTKPSFTPPGWLFGPVWGLLYTLMAVSLFLLWRKYSYPRARRAVGLFLLQLTFNAAWTPVFFGGHSPFGGLVIITILWVLIFMTMLAALPVSWWAMVLLIPYVCWVTFALVLNGAIVNLNS
ncbi:MAG: tryptophan-rich sensory protein [Sedimentisphaerales bacterium]|nr:tryptophan-rich sensory protein [Sedimentisphaerales bacterium]